MTRIATFSSWLAEKLGLSAAALGLLIGLHVQMDGLLNVADHVVSDESKFRGLHEVYLTTISLQWIVCLIFLLTTLQTWRKADAAQVRSETR